MIKPLTHISNISFRTVKFHDKMKPDKTRIPIFKNIKQTEGSNHRPISLLTRLSNILSNYYFHRDYLTAFNVYFYYKKNVRTITKIEYLPNTYELFAKLSIFKLKDIIAYKSYVFNNMLY